MKKYIFTRASTTITTPINDECSKIIISEHSFYCTANPKNTNDELATFEIPYQILKSL